jgi:catechol-2,3-dioxygenase
MSNPSPAKLAHVVFRTARFEQMSQWYQQALHAQVAYANDYLAFLTYDDEHHRVALVNMPSLSDVRPDAAGLDHVAFTFASLGDLLGAFSSLKERDILPYWCVNHGPTTSLYYHDPDNNQIEFQVDNFATDEELDRWFSSGSFEANPIGVVFDPDRLLREFQEGTDPATLVRQDHWSPV